MGKKQREKKSAKIEQELAEKSQIAERKKQRLAPSVKLAKKALMATLATVILLYIGVVVNSRLPDILVRISQGS